MTNFYDTNIAVFGEREVSVVNLTPHAICLNDGRRFQPHADIGVARVTASFRHNGGHHYVQEFGEVENLPAPEQGVVFLVSGMVLSALAGTRSDVVAPATGHPDCVRND